MRTALVTLAMACLIPVPGTVAQEPPVFRGIVVRSAAAARADGYRYTYTLAVPEPLDLPIGVFEIQGGVCREGDDARFAQPPDWLRGECWLDEPAGWTVVVWIAPRSVPLPGTVLHGFGFSSSQPPAIRTAEVAAAAFQYLQALYDRDPAAFDREWDEERQRAFVEDRLIHQPVLAPIVDESVGSFAHWDRWLSDLERAGELGWIADAQLGAQILARAREARVAAGEGRSAEARAALEAVISLAETAPPGALTSEGSALVVLNAEALRDVQPAPCEPALELGPPEQEHALGETATLTARLENRATHEPLVGEVVRFEVTEGPHAGLTGEAVTGGETGTASWVFVGRRVGEDRVVAEAGGGDGGGGPCGGAWVRSEPVAVRWSGGPDLEVAMFTPAVLRSAPGRRFVVNEATVNVGSLPSPPTVTRYWLSTEEPVDPATAVVVGQRQVPALDPEDRTVFPPVGGESRVENLELTVPEGLPPGWYHLIACADADDRVVELDETNNCSDASLLARVSVGYVEPANAPPDCSGAAVSPSEVWPPDHRMVALTVSGITDPDGDPVTVRAVSVRQDEPVTGVGEGNTAPDATLVPPAVRAERMGGGDGRVYHVRVRAEDGNGGACTAEVTVCVPHDRRHPCTDGGPLHDSTGGG